MGRLGKRIMVLALLFTLGFSLLGLQLARIQLWLGPEFKARALDQQRQTLALNTPRGHIYDRNMVSLTGAQGQPVLVVFPPLVEDKETVARELAAFLGWKGEEISSLLDRGQAFQIEVERLVPALEVFAAGSFPGVFLLQKEERYGDTALARHLIGYVQQGENKGVAGLERYYNSYLQGGRKLELVAWVDANGEVIPGLGLHQVAQGRAGQGDLVLTIDARIQRIVEEVMEERVSAGAVVVVQVQTGEILALASRPNYRQDRIGEYLARTDACLLNRALRNYPPGSLFKIIVLAAALEEGLSHLEEEFSCGGSVAVGEEVFRCHQHREGGHGLLTLGEAFAQSCNPVFITLAQRIGSERLLNYSRRLGIDEAVLGLPEEKEGYLAQDLPYPGDLANLSLGQGPVLVTPLQIAQITQAVANGGFLKPLQLVRDGPEDKLEGEKRERRVLSASTAAALHQLFQRTVEEGTGTGAASPWFTCGGKTGTAETGKSTGEGELVCHAWFAGFAPLEEPLLAVVVLVEEGGSGGKVAAPIFKAILSRVFAEIPISELAPVPGL